MTTQLRLRRVGKQYLDNTGSEDRVIDPWNTVDISLWCDLGGVGLKALSGARGFRIGAVTDFLEQTDGTLGVAEFGQSRFHGLDQRHAETLVP